MRVRPASNPIFSFCFHKFLGISCHFTTTVAVSGFFLWPHRLYRQANKILHIFPSVGLFFDFLPVPPICKNIFGFFFGLQAGGVSMPSIARRGIPRASPPPPPAQRRSFSSENTRASRPGSAPRKSDFGCLSKRGRRGKMNPTPPFRKPL